MTTTKADHPTPAPSFRRGALAVLSALIAAGCAAAGPANYGPSEPLPNCSEAGGYAETGTASWYGRPHHGRRTASGQVFDMHRLTAAHRTLPFGSRIRVTNIRNGRSVLLTVNDRGPFVGGRVLDVSYRAARELNFVRAGLAPVRLETITIC